MDDGRSAPALRQLRQRVAAAAAKARKWWLETFLPEYHRVNGKYLGLPRVTVWGLVIFVVALIGFYSDLNPMRPVRRMSGDFRVAVAAFEVIGDRQYRHSGQELADGVYLRLEQELAELAPSFTVTLREPSHVGAIEGATREKRAAAAAAKAEQIDADLIVYGLVDATGPVWVLLPEFFVSNENLVDAQEITGQHELGAPFQVPGQGSVATRIEVSTQLTARAQLLSLMTVGLAYYVAHDFAEAQRVFQRIESEYDWSEMGGKEVLYLLLGNAAGKNGDLEQAERAYQSALAANPDYSRALAGLGSVYYMRALPPADDTGELTAIDVTLLEQSIVAYERAAQASVQPALSDIATKIRFGLGQAYFALHLQNGDKPLLPALQAFEAVIAEYGEGRNPRVRELAAESHARLGRIHSLSGNTDAAIAEYEQARALLYDVPERRQLYEERIRALQGATAP